MKKIFLVVTFISAISSAMAQAVVTQKYWRWRNDNGSESAATWSGLQNTGTTQALCSSENVRLRMGLYVEVDPATGVTSTKIMDYFISYSTSPTGPFTKLTKNSTTAPFILAISNNVAGGIATTKQLSWLETNPYNTGNIVDGNRTNSLLVSSGSASPRLTEFEWVIKKTSAALAQTYYFKLEGLNAYETPLPSITLTEISTTVNATACESYNFYNNIIRF